MKFVIAYDATPEHPAMVEKIENTINVGKYTTVATAAMLTPLDKAERITRLDELLHAVKKARQRANNSVVVNVDKVAQKLFAYINTGK